MSKKSYIIIIIVAIVSFTYGLTAGHYKIFPYPQIEEMRSNFIIKYLLDTGKKILSPRKTDPAIVKNTFLQRLLIKEIPLETNPEIKARYITNLGDMLYILNTHGELLIYNMNDYNEPENYVNQVPMNYELLLLTPIPEMDSFNLFNFRTLGIHAERNKDGHHELFVSHHAYEPTKECISFNISRTTLDVSPDQVDQVNDWNTIFSASPCFEPEQDDFWLSLRSGGNIVSYDENRLLVTVGDYAYDGSSNTDSSFAMDTTNVYGKILLVDKKTGEHSIYAKGIRNSQGLFVDQNGTIWSTDHGPLGGDELNIVKKGHNYGWPEVTYGLNYENEPWPFSTVQGQHYQYEKPVYAWLRAVAPTNLVRIEGDKFKFWKGDLLVATLAGRSIHRLRLGDDNRVIYDEKIEFGHRIRDLTILSNGAIGMITDEMILIIIEDGGGVFEKMNNSAQERFQNMEM